MHMMHWMFKLHPMAKNANRRSPLSPLYGDSGSNNVKSEASKVLIYAHDSLLRSAHTHTRTLTRTARCSHIGPQVFLPLHLYREIYRRKDLHAQRETKGKVSLSPPPLAYTRVDPISLLLFDYPLEGAPIGGRPGSYSDTHARWLKLHIFENSKISSKFTTCFVYYACLWLLSGVPSLRSWQRDSCGSGSKVWWWRHIVRSLSTRWLELGQVCVHFRGLTCTHISSDWMLEFLHHLLNGLWRMRASSIQYHSVLYASS